MKRSKGIGKRISAWLLTLVMVLSLVMVPAGKVEAEESVTVSGTDVITATDSGVYVSYTSKLEFEANVWGTGSPAVDLYKYEFTLHNNTDSTISDWEVKITPNSNAYWNSGWNGATYDSSTGSVVLGTYKGTGEDGSTWSTAEVASGSTVTGMGAQCRANIFEGATIVLTYNIGSSTQAPSVDDTATDPSTIGSTSDKVTATVTQTSQSYDYYQYEIAVSNGLSETISDWIVVIPVTGIASSDAWDGSWAKVKWSYDDSYVYVTSNSGETISAGGSLSGESYKIQYSGSSALSTNEAVVYYKTGSGSTGAFDSVISAGTQPSGGSSGGGSSGGEVFDGSNIGTIDTSLDYNFAKLLQYSLYFYDANMCGDQVSETSLYSKDLYNGWRGDCHVNDKFTYNGIEYSAVGGYHDAGDHVKFGLPMSQAMTALGMSYYEFGQAFDELGQKDHLKTITDYYCTYVKSCTVLNAAGTQAEAFCYQVGDGDADHASWVAPEVENEKSTNRTYTLVATSSNPATDIVGGTVAALTLNYLNFGNEEDLKYAKALFEFAKNNSKAEADYQGGFYHSGWGGWQDEYCLAAALLYIATDDDDYYATEYTSNDANNGNIEKPYGWENAYQAAVFYAPDSSGNKTSQTNTILNWFNTTANNSSSGYYCGDSWGSARVNCNVQFMMMVSDKHAGTNTYGSWCRYQMSQILGNNSVGKNLVCGYNTNSPTKPHHRAASGYSGWTDFNNNVTQKYTLYGALCGGPTSSDFSTYNDAVNDAVSNEVALDYNACLVGSAAALYLLNKDSTDAGFTNQTIHEDFYGGSNFALAGGENATKPTAVTLDTTSKELMVGETFKLTATVEPGDASQSVTWSSDNPSVATVSGGVVTAKAGGTATITATTVATAESGEALTATCAVTVTEPAELTCNAANLKCSDLVYGYTSVSGASANVTNVGGVATTPSSVEFESGDNFILVKKPTDSISPGAYAAIEVSPKTGLAAGDYTDKVIITYDSKTLSIPVSVTVAKKPITVKANDVEMTYGEAIPTLSVDLSYEDSLVAGDTLHYQVTTTATEASDADTYPIKVEVTDDTNYDITVQEGTLTIKPKAVNSITKPTAATVEMGQTLEDSALTGGSTEYGSFAWKDASTLLETRGTYAYDVVLTLSEQALKNYSFAEVEGYDSGSGTVTMSVEVNVTRAGLPKITFPTASDITYGQALNDSQLVGGSTEYGTFAWEEGSYVPTESEIGTIQKKVIFTWNDTVKDTYGLEEDEMTQEQMVTVNINKLENDDVPETPVLVSRTANRITVSETEGVEYSMDGENWQASGTFAGLTTFKSYKVYARYKETVTQYASAACDTPLQVYTLVTNPYIIDVSKLSGDNAADYVDALRVDSSSEPTVGYADDVLTLKAADVTYTIVGTNENLKVCVPNDSTTVILSSATIGRLDLSKNNATSEMSTTIQVKGTSTASSIVSSTVGDVKITGDGTLKTDYIDVKGILTIEETTLVADATGTGKAAISAGSIVIEDSKVTATGDSGNAAMKADTITITDSEVVATGGAGAAAIEATESITIENADVKVDAGAGSTDKAIVSDNIVLKGVNNVTTDGGIDNLYSTTPKDENGTEIAMYTVTFVDTNGTTINSEKCYSGSTIVLPDLEDIKGCVVRWKEKSTGTLYQEGISYTVKGNATFTVNVTKIKVTRITLDSTAETLEVGDGVALAESVLPANAYDTSVTWSSSNTAVATVDAEGEVTAVAEGTAIITVTANDGSGVSATCTITVVNGDIAVEQIKITGDTKKVAPGKKLKLTATVYPENATNQNVKWKVSNSMYASVNSNGVVTTKKAGKGKQVTVTAYSEEDNSIVGTYKISVMKNAVKKIKLSAKTTTLKKGKSVTIKAKFTPAKGISKELTWTSSDNKVATVNAKGKVTAKKKGTVKITAKAKDGSGKKATIKIKVK